jgi:hypothetical protein
MVNFGEKFRLRPAGVLKNAVFRRANQVLIVAAH